MAGRRSTPRLMLSIAKGSRLRIGWILLCALILIRPGNCRAAGDMQKLRRQATEFEWADLNPDKSTPSQAGQWAKELRPDGSWADIDYADQSRGFWKTAAHIKRTRAMAAAYAQGKSAGHPDAALKAAALAAAHYWIAHDFRNPNWWFNEIGVPRDMAAVLLSMKGEMRPTDLAAGLKIVARATVSMTGQNRVWKAGIVFRRALIEGNLALARRARNAILGELTITGSEGLQVDDSFHQHGPQQQMGNYGLAFAEDMASWAWLWRGTRLAMPKAKLGLLRRYALRGEAAVTVNGSMDISSCGRQLFPSSATGKGRNVLSLLAVMAEVDPQNADAYRTAIIQDSQPSGSGVPPAREAVMNKNFFRSDYLVHRRPGFYASVKLCSNRVIGGEATNAENISGRYLADGATFLYQTSKEYADIFPVWDWRRLPGVTCVTTGTTLLPAGKMAVDFAGGASNGTYGVEGLDYHRDGVSARKGWFFLDDEVFCLGAGITGTTGPVRTSIDQRFAEGQTVTSGGPLSPGIQKCNHVSWILNGTEGYLFERPETVSAGIQDQTGTWKSVYASGSEAKITHSIFSVWIDHASRNATYAYAMIPGATENQLQSLAATSSVTVLSNSPDVQAIRVKAAGIIEILFYKAATLYTEGLSIQTDGPCALLMHKSKLYVADPTQKELEVHLTINGKSVSVGLPEGQMAGSSVRVRY